MSLIKIIWQKRWVIRALPVSIWFNFKTLPFSQAVRLPILLYKPKFASTSGKIIIDSPVKFGMIKLGCNCVSIYPNDGIVYENNGVITFKGRATIGNNSAIAIGHHGHLVIDDFFRATTTLKLICYNKIHFEKEVLVGWNCLFTDTDFHKLTFANAGGGYSRGFGEIRIGHNCWIANGCKIYKNINIPANCVIASDTVLYKTIDCEPYSLIGNDAPIKVKATGIFHNWKDDKIDYTINQESYEA